MKNFTFSIVFFFLFTFFSSAQESDLIITEIMYNPLTDSKGEWIEIYNKGFEPIDLTGYVIDDNSGASLGSANISEFMLMPSTSVILFDDDLPKEIFTQDWGNVSAIAVKNWPSLNNSGDTIGIWNSIESYNDDNENQLNVFTKVIYMTGGDWPSTSNGKSIFLKDLQDDNTNGTNWLLSSLNPGEDETPLFNSYESAQGDIGSPGISDSLIDRVAPTITCNEPISKPTNKESCVASIDVVFPTATDIKTATEDLKIIGTRLDGFELTDPFPKGETILTWTAEDEAGNISEPCEQVITVIDDVIPELICPDNINLEGADSEVITIILPNVTDNCDVPSLITFVRSDGDTLVLEDAFPVGSTTITWTAVDASNNVSMCSQMVTISLPQSNEKDITAVNLAGQIGITKINSEERVLSLTMPYGTDLTSLSPELIISIGASVSPESGSSQDFSTPVIYNVVASDDSELAWIISIDALEDEEIPVITCPADFIVSNDRGECGAMVNFEVSATDNSDIVTITSDYDSDSIFPIGTTVVSSTAIDEAGNEVMCSFTITVEDIEESTLVCSVNIEKISIDGEPISLLIEAPEHTDNCSLHPDLMGVRDDNFEMSEPFNMGTTTITWSISDLAGNVGTCTQTVTISPQVSDLTVTSFILINADTNEDLFELTDGMQIDNSKLPTLNLDIRANTTVGVESVRLSISSTGGGFSNTRTESLLPFAFFQDLPIGDYMGTTFPHNDFLTITATPFSLNNLGGIEGSPFSLTFEIADYCQEATDRSYVDTFPADCNGIRGRAVLGTTLKISDADAPFWEIDPVYGDYFRSQAPGIYTVTVGEEPGCTKTIEYTIDQCTTEILTVTGFTLINADTDQPIRELVDGDQIDINSLSTRHLDIRVNTTDDVESVRISIIGALMNERTESLPPYALYRDLPIGDYIGEEFVLGEYGVTAIPYLGNGLAGDLGTALTLNFELVDGDPACASLSAVYTSVDPTTCGDGGSVTVIPSGGSPPYVVSWSSFSFEGETATGLSAGNYSANVYDANGCSIRIDVQILDPELPEVILNSFSDVLSTDASFELLGGLPEGGSYSGDGVADGMFDPTIGVGSYEIVYTYTDEVTDCTNSATQEITVITESANNIIQYWLVNADNEMDLLRITDGLQIDISVLPTPNLDIRAETGVTTESVGFELSGTQIIIRGESVPPYALFQDLPIGDYIGHNFEIGEYTLAGIPYTQNSLMGEVGETLTIDFEFVDSTPTLAITGFTLIDAIDESEHFDLIDGMEIRFSEIGSLFLDIRANTTNDVESVRLELSGEQNTARTESRIPYALFQDLPIGDYKGNNFAYGTYTLKATPYSGNNLSGEMGIPLIISFSIVEDLVAISLKISPNNVSTLARASFEKPTEIKQILIFDMSGRMIESYNPKYIKSGDDYILDVNFYQQGTYIVKAIDNRGVPYQKQMVVKRQ